MQGKDGSLSDGLKGVLVAEGEEAVSVRPDEVGRNGLHVHDVEGEFEELGPGVDGDGFGWDTGLEEVSEVGAGTVSGDRWWEWDDEAGLEWDGLVGWDRVGVIWVRMR